MDKWSDLHNCVYRYVDCADGKIKYIGIVNDGALPTRHKQHQCEDWYKQGKFICQFIQMNNKSECEAMESHLISVYQTGDYYNKAKVGWGEISFIETPAEGNWRACPFDTLDYWFDNLKETISMRCSAKECLENIDRIVSLKQMADTNNIRFYP